MYTQGCRTLHFTHTEWAGATAQEDSPTHTCPIIGTSALPWAPPPE